LQNIIITNNPLVKERISSINIDMLYFEDLSYFDIMLKVRDLVHSGHTLLTHPIVSSIKPNVMPYKTVVLSQKKITVDFDSLELIDNALKLVQSFEKRDHKRLTESAKEDLRLIDYDCINGSILSIL
jgi:hypothetical protein